jgi:hypothetical protein
MHINDWAAIQTLFDKLNKQLEKALKAAGALGVPRPYIKLLVELEDFLNKTLAGKFDTCLYLWFLVVEGFLGGRIRQQRGPFSWPFPRSVYRFCTGEK